MTCVETLWPTLKELKAAQRTKNFVCRNESRERTRCSFKEGEEPRAGNTCYVENFPAEEPLFVAVNISADDWISELSEAIQKKLSSLGREVILKDLRLFRVPSFFPWQ